MAERSLLEKVQAAMQGEEKWALLYLVDWNTDEEGKPVPPTPDVHGFYDTEAEARAMARSKSGRYYVRRMRNYTGSGI